MPKQNFIPAEKTAEFKNISHKDELPQYAEQYTVFLVEDSRDDRTQIIQTLKKSPYIYNIHSFKNGDVLLAHFHREGYYMRNSVRHIPTFVLLDIHVPGTDGLEVLKELKGNPLTKDIPIMVLTNDTSSKMALKAFELKANAFIIKPLGIDQVHEVIHKGHAWPHQNS